MERTDREREWMPKVETLFGTEDGPILDVIVPSEVGLEGETRHCADSASQKSCLSETDVCELRKNSGSVKSGCLDPPPEEDQLNSDSSSEVDELAERCGQLEVVNDFLRQKLKENGGFDESDILQWIKLPSLNTSVSRRSRFGSFDSLRRAWEVQRDLLLESLQEKDATIRRQTALLAEKSSALARAVDSLDRVETRYGRELDAFNGKMKQFELEMLERAQQISEGRDGIQRRQERMGSDLQALSISARTDIASLQRALQKRTRLYTQSEEEKQDILKDLDATREQVAQLERGLSRCSEELATKETEIRRLSQQIATRPDTSSSAEAPCVFADQDSLYSATQENYQLRREVIALREKLIDYKEHSTELESDVREQQQAFYEARSQIQELELLRNAKQELMSIISDKQNAINQLKRAMLQTPGMVTSVEIQLLEEILTAQIRCEETESLFLTARTERDSYKREMQKLIQVVQSMDKSARRQARTVSRLQKEKATITRESNSQRTEIEALKTNLRVETLKSASRSRRRIRSCGGEEVDRDVMQELFKSKLALSEMSELVIHLRQQVSSLVEANKMSSSSSPKTKNGCQTLLRKTLTLRRSP